MDEKRVMKGGGGVGGAVRTRRRSEGVLRFKPVGGKKGGDGGLKGGKVERGGEGGGVWVEKSCGRVNGWLGSVDVCLPNTNGATQRNLLVSREVFLFFFCFLFFFFFFFFFFCSLDLLLYSFI